MFLLVFHSKQPLHILNNITVKKFRKSLTRLRLSSHRLKIETGRWHKPISIPVDQRKCENCNELEDEYHFCNTAFLVTMSQPAESFLFMS